MRPGSQHVALLLKALLKLVPGGPGPPPLQQPRGYIPPLLIPFLPPCLPPSPALSGATSALDPPSSGLWPLPSGFPSASPSPRKGFSSGLRCLISSSSWAISSPPGPSGANSAQMAPGTTLRAQTLQGPTSWDVCQEVPQPPQAAHVPR